MSATRPYEILLEDALLLPVADRSRMAARLIESLDDDVAISPAWQAEISRRIQGVDDGSIRTFRHEEVMEDAGRLLATIRGQ